MNPINNVIFLDVNLASPILNASGCNCTSKDDLIELDKSSCGAIVSKSCTLYFRKENDHPRYYENELGSINSTGLANYGYDYYRPDNLQINKPYILSVSSLNHEDTFKILSDYSLKYENNIVEVNVSCPNIV